MGSSTFQRGFEMEKRTGDNIWKLTSRGAWIIILIALFTRPNGGQPLDLPWTARILFLKYKVMFYFLLHAPNFLYFYSSCSSWVRFGPGLGEWSEQVLHVIVSVPIPLSYRAMYLVSQMDNLSNWLWEGMERSQFLDQKADASILLIDNLHQGSPLPIWIPILKPDLLSEASWSLKLYYNPMKPLLFLDVKKK